MRLPVRERWWITVLPLYGLLMDFWPTISSGFRRMQTDAGDTRFNNYILEHVCRNLFGGNLWSPPIYYPAKNMLAVSDNLLGAAPLYALFRIVTSADVAFQLWMMTCVIGCFASFYMLARALDAAPECAGVGAFLFAFGLPRVAQFGHAQLLPEFFAPLAVLFTWRFLHQPSSRDAALALLFLYLQFLAGIYLGWFLFLAMPVFITLIAVLIGPRHLTAYLPTVLWMAAITGLALYFVVAPYRDMVAARVTVDASDFMPTIATWFLPLPGTIWRPLLHGLEAQFVAPIEHHNFMGFGALVLACVCAWRIYRGQEKRPVVIASLATAVAITLATLQWPGGVSLWHVLVPFIPGASSIRAVCRVWTVVDLFLLIPVTLTLPCMQKRSLWVALLILEQMVFRLPAFHKMPLLRETAEVAQLMRGGDIGYLAITGYYPITQITAMWAGLQAERPVVNGYASYFPSSFPGQTRTMTLAEIVAWLGPSARGSLVLVYPHDVAPDAEAARRATRQIDTPDGRFRALTVPLSLP